MKNRSEIFFEMIRLGNVVKVTAIDAETGIEAVVQGPVSASPSDLQQLAKNKLDYLMKKAAGNKDET